MTARLPQGPREVTFESAFEPKRLRWGRALADALYGACPSLSRLTGISERMLQYFQEPQAPHASPFEEVGDLLEALRKIGRGPEADQLLSMLAAEQNFDIAPRLTVFELTPASSIAEQAVDVGREYAEASVAAVAAARTGDKRDFEKQIDEAIRAAHALRVSVLGKPASGPRRTSK